MDTIIKRPLGLALLITAAVALTAQPPSRQTAIAPVPHSRPAPTLPAQPQRSPLLEESPTIARLVLRVESLFQPTTTN